MPKLSDLPVANNVKPGDYITGITDPLTLSDNKIFTIATLFSNVDTISINNLVLANNHTPTSNTETNLKGTMFFTNTHLYIAISNNILRRISLETF